MARNGVNATIVPQTDPHQSEYIASHWQARRWLSGFTGSAGTLVVTSDQALLWVDSRYFLQAAKQLEGTEIAMMKIATPGFPTINEWLIANLRPGETVGIDGLLFSRRDAMKLQRDLAAHNLRLNVSFDPVAEIWTDRPDIPADPVIVHDAKYAGATAADKIAFLRHFLEKNRCDAMLVTPLDEIAWALNVRSRDVRCNPVLTSYLFISQTITILFLNESKLTDDARAHLAAAGVETRPYGSLLEYLGNVSDPAIAVDPATTSIRVIETLGDRCRFITSPIPLAKACKNATQIQGFRDALTRDGVALVRAMMEIEATVKRGDRLTELGVAAILRRHRSEQELFFDESFESIVGYGPHGAIVHYSPTPESDVEIGTDSLLLMDSGAQYLDGTTDITRTITLGTPTPTQIADFTAVLQGNISLAMAIFPTGTRGVQLDALAHEPLWSRGLNYLHGTGHGVGHFLNVHEGPQSVRMNEVPVELEPGMIVTDEPGLYREGHHGIRCETMLLVERAFSNEFGDFLRFDTITIFPFDRRLIDPSMLTDPQLEWLNRYHARVYISLLPYLSPAEALWLHSATAPIVK